MERDHFGPAEAGQRSSDRSQAFAEWKKGFKADESSLHERSPREVRLIAEGAAEADEASYWQDALQLESWAEHRRRGLLQEALDACAAFKVDILILPEYSVRPDTVAWLRAELEKKNHYNLAILAGTYRLFGNRSDLGFTDHFAKVFGVQDHDLIIDSLEPMPNVTDSGHLSAFLTLLVKTGDEQVLTFTRRKKYPSLAAEEVINPSTEPWQPLLTLENLVTELERPFDESLNRRISETSRSDYSAKRLLPLLDGTVLKQLYLAELICSEIFLPTNPANHFSLAHEYGKMREYFSGVVSSSPLEVVNKDLNAFAAHLGLGNSSARKIAKLTRRTLLAVPAMTSRSADYWIYGQAALLSAGTTTIFCNAVNGKESVGGSCIIGRNSWKNPIKKPGIPQQITPYGGWSRGIYYNSPDDTLGAREQALVIVDIDPVYMNEGKPRPQSLPVPLQLVAHLPILESIRFLEADAGRRGKKRDFQAISEVIGAVEQIRNITKGMSRNLFPAPSLSSRTGNKDSLYAVARNLSRFFADEKSFLQRLDTWRESGGELPSVGIPPAVTDWLWVDHTPTVQGVAKVFVPPWTPGGEGIKGSTGA